MGVPDIWFGTAGEHHKKNDNRDGVGDGLCPRRSILFSGARYEGDSADLAAKPKTA